MRPHFFSGVLISISAKFWVTSVLLQKYYTKLTYTSTHIFSSYYPFIPNIFIKKIGILFDKYQLVPLKFFLLILYYLFANQTLYSDM